MHAVTPRYGHLHLGCQQPGTPLSRSDGRSPKAECRARAQRRFLAEIAIKQTRGKLTFGKADAMTGVADLRLRILPYAAEHGFHRFDLPTHHADPFDRQIISQALVENIAVVTPDESFRLYEGIKVVW